MWVETLLPRRYYDESAPKSAPTVICLMKNRKTKTPEPLRLEET